MATVDLSWTDNSSDENGFYVYRSTTSNPTFSNGSGDYSQIADLAADTTTYTDSNAADGTTVYYAVTAYNGAGESSETTANVTTPSTTQTISTPVTSASGITATPTLTGSGSTTVTSPTSSAGGTTPTVTAKASGTATVTSQTASAGGVTPTTTVSPSGTASLAVPTALASGLSPAPTATLTATPPSTVTSLSSTTQDASTVDLTWTPSSDSHDGERVYRSTVSNPTFDSGNADYTEIADIAANTGSYTDSSAPSGEDNLTYAVVAYNSGGESAEKTTLTATPASSQSVTDIDTGFITARTSTGTQSVTTGFQPDLVLLTATNTLTSSQTGTEQTGGGGNDYGWCHGAIDFTSGDQRAIFSGTGSNSTNGCATETTDIECLNVLELSVDGATIQNRIQATATATSNGFDLDYTSVGNAEQIQYRAYKFDTSGGVDIGFFNAKTSTGTQSVSTSVEPDFVKFWGQPRATTNNETVNDANDWGNAHGWLTPDEQYAMSVTSYSSNVDDFVYGARDNACLLVKHDEQKNDGGPSGTTVADGTLTASGFDLNYTSTYSDGEIIMYCAIEADEGVDVDVVNAPESATTRTATTSMRQPHFTANAAVDSMNVDSHEASNTVTYGYSHGVGGTATSEQSVLAIGASPVSINDHRAYGASGEAVRILHTDQNASDDGSEDASWSNKTTNEITLNFSAATDSGQSGLDSSHTTNPVVVWGVRQGPTIRNVVLATSSSSGVTPTTTVSPSGSASLSTPTSSSSGVTPTTTVSPSGTATVTSPTSSAGGTTPIPTATGSGNATVLSPTSSASGVTPTLTLTFGAASISIPTASGSGLTPTATVSPLGTASLAVPTAPSSGLSPAPTATGVGSVNVVSPTSSSSGVTPTTTVSPSGSAIVSPPTANSTTQTPTATVSGNASASVTAPSLSGSGVTPTTTVTPSGTATVVTPTNIGEGRTPKLAIGFGTIFVSLPSASASGVTPTLTPNGIGTVTFTMPVSSANATTPTPTATGSGTATVPSPTSSSSGVTPTTTVSPSGSATVSALTASASGVTPTLTPNGIGTVTFTMPVSSANATTPTTTVTGSGVTQLNVSATSASASTPAPLVEKTFLVSLPTAAASGVTETPTLAGVGTATFPVPTTSASGVTPTLTPKGIGTVTVPITTATATAITNTPTLSPSGTATVSSPTTSGNGTTPSLDVTATGTATVTSPVVTVSGVTPVPTPKGIGTIVVSAPTSTASGTTPRTEIFVGSIRHFYAVSGEFDTSENVLGEFDTSGDVLGEFDSDYDITGNVD